MPKEKDPNLQNNKYNPALHPGWYTEYPAGQNDKPFMSYEDSQRGANGAYPKGQK